MADQEQPASVHEKIMALLRDNTQTLMELRERATETKAALERSERELLETQQRLHDAIAAEDDPYERRRLEGAYTNVRRRRGRIAQGYNLADELLQSLPLAPVATDAQAEQPEQATMTDSSSYTMTDSSSYGQGATNV